MGDTHARRHSQDAGDPAAGGGAHLTAADGSLELQLTPTPSTEQASPTDLAARVQALTEQAGVLVVFILVDRPEASVLDMRSVSFEDGRPVFTSMLDAFPFPLYIVLRDTGALPARLADLLHQWIGLVGSG